MPTGYYARLSFTERFWMNVVCNLATGCWEWTGGLLNSGYGSCRVDGHTMSTHRASWLLHYGEKPMQWVLHHCDNRRCVRPDHLFLGDHQTNMNDMAAKGRAPRGERAGNVKLTDQQVIEMRARHRAGENCTVIAAAYGLNHSTVSYIIRRDTWAHLQ